MVPGESTSIRLGDVVMRVELELPAKVVSGAPVPVTVRVRNDGIQPAELSLTGNPVAFDIIVQDRGGSEVWSRLRGQIVSMILQVAILQPGECVEFVHAWDQRDNAGRRVAEGDYRVQGILPGPEGALRSEPRRLVIAG